MRKRNRPYNRTAPANTASEAAPFQWFYLLLTIVCAAFLAAGFFFAAQQHFLAMSLGIKNSDLREQIEDLKGEQRRLVLSREIVRSPLEVKKIARLKGLDDGQPNIATVSGSEFGSGNGLVTRTVSQAKTGASAPGARPVKAFFPVGAEVSKLDRRRVTAASVGAAETATVDLRSRAKR